MCKFTILVLSILVLSLTVFSDVTAGPADVDAILAKVATDEGYYQSIQFNYSTYQMTLDKNLDFNTIRRVDLKAGSAATGKQALDLTDGHYFLDIQGSSPWRNGVADYIKFRNQYSYNGSRTIHGTTLEFKDPSQPAPTLTINKPVNRFAEIHGQLGMGVGFYYHPPFYEGIRLSGQLEHVKKAGRITGAKYLPNNAVEIEVTHGFPSEDKDTRATITYSMADHGIKSILFDDTLGTVWSRIIYEYSGDVSPRTLARIVKVNDHDARGTVSEYTNVKINQPINEAQYDIVMPSGTHVIDHVEEKSYNIGVGVRDAQREAAEYAANHRLVSAKRTPLWQWIGIGAIILVAVLLSYRFLARYRRRVRGASKIVGILLVIACVPHTPATAQLSCDSKGDWVAVHPGISPSIIQHCGIRSTLLILESCRVDYDPAELSRSLPPSSQGHNLADLQRILNSYGLRTAARKDLTARDIGQFLTPDWFALYALPNCNGNHFVVMTRRADGTLLLLDPPNEPKPTSQFDSDSLNPVAGTVLFISRP